MTLSNTIVLADDDQDHAFLFSRILKKVDPSKLLFTAKDGEELFELLKTVTPELLFLDLKMPCKNGLECLQELRQNPNYQHLRIIVYSSSVHMQDIRKSYNYKANLYLVKPFDTEHLTKALKAIFETDWQTNLKDYHYFINNRFVPFTAFS